MENNTPENNEASETVGEILHNKRKEIGLSLDEITEKLKTHLISASVSFDWIFFCFLQR